MKIAVLSDIHGNRWALEAVVEDLHRRRVDRVVNLGDALYGPLDPARTADLILSLEPVSVLGNEDRAIIDETTPAEPRSSLAFTRTQLTPEHMRWLGSLAPTAVVEDKLFLFHGTPECDDEYLLWEIFAAGKAPTPLLVLERALAGVRQQLILCGHDHTPSKSALSDGRLIVNPGSVGLQAYTSDYPYHHAMAAGDPKAHYAVLEQVNSSWEAELVAVPYDFESAARAALEHSRPDWAYWLRTGLA